MNNLGLVLGITISIAALLLVLNATPNVAKAYSCTSSSSTMNGNGGTTRVSGSSGSCATSAAAASSSHSVSGFIQNGSPPNIDARSTSTSPGSPGSSASLSVGGTHSSCIAESTNHNVGGLVVFDSQLGSCSAHSP
ncbi:MAG: hypothetical protein DLM72_06825 [Candidatus Nitrosopolaris wilkensis]|nr:MAG: hypothetical protein DLM72_06825 [Candidatus Nitrosopolaris wilkensis]